MLHLGDTAVGNTKTVEHLFPYSHSQDGAAGCIFNPLNTQPLAKGTVVKHLVYYFLASSWLSI